MTVAPQSSDRDYARQVIEAEARAVGVLVDRLDEGFFAAANAVHDCCGRVVVCGMGKAGIMGMKLSASLASTGTPSIFLHPADAIHGDLGRIVPEDVAIVLSNSGESEEVVRLKCWEARKIDKAKGSGRMAKGKKGMVQGSRCKAGRQVHMLPGIN